MSISWENTANTTKKAAAALETQEFSSDSEINDKIKLAVAGLQKNVANLFWSFPTDRDKKLVADFLITCIQHENSAIKTRQVYLIALAYLSRYLKDKLKNEKSFEDITAGDLSKFLNSLQPNDPKEDLNQSWINTQKTWGHPIQKFFKWLA